MKLISAKHVITGSIIGALIGMALSKSSSKNMKNILVKKMVAKN